MKIRDFGQHDFLDTGSGNDVGSCLRHIRLQDKNTGARVVQLMLKFSLCVERVGIDHDHTCSKRSQAGDQILNQIRHLYRDAITTGQP